MRKSSLTTYRKKKKSNCLSIKNFQIERYGLVDREIADAVLSRTNDNSGRRLEDEESAEETVSLEK